MAAPPNTEQQLPLTECEYPYWREINGPRQQNCCLTITRLKEHRHIQEDPRDEIVQRILNETNTATRSLLATNCTTGSIISAPDPFDFEVSSTDHVESSHSSHSSHHSYIPNTDINSNNNFVTPIMPMNPAQIFFPTPLHERQYQRRYTDSSQQNTTIVQSQHQQQTQAQSSDETAGIQEQQTTTPGPTIIQNSLTQPQQQSSFNTQPPTPPAAVANQLLQIRYRFQCSMTLIALLYSVLLFAILVCWVGFTSAYVVSIDKSCNVPLKTYYWLATIQLIMDVFRTDIMKYFCSWDPDSNHHRQTSTALPNNNQNTNIPTRVAVYNVAYLVYAFYVLQMGVRSVFIDVSACTCSETAPELFTSGRSFVCLSISAWIMILLGYLVPLCFLAMLMSRTGMSVLRRNNAVIGVTFVGVPGGSGMHGDWRNVWNNVPGRNLGGAPPECIELLDVMHLYDFPEEYPKDCCICMSNFAPQDLIVSTPCFHVFHKICFNEWLELARSCPVCRTDIPDSLGVVRSGTSRNSRGAQTSSDASRQIEVTAGSSFPFRWSRTSLSEGTFESSSDGVSSLFGGGDAVDNTVVTRVSNIINRSVANGSSDGTDDNVVTAASQQRQR